LQDFKKFPFATLEFLKTRIFFFNLVSNAKTLMPNFYK